MYTYKPHRNQEGSEHNHHGHTPSKQGGHPPWVRAALALAAGWESATDTHTHMKGGEGRRAKREPPSATVTRLMHLRRRSRGTGRRRWRLHNDYLLPTGSGRVGGGRSVVRALKQQVDDVLGGGRACGGRVRRRGLWAGERLHSSSANFTQRTGQRGHRRTVPLSERRTR